MKNKNIINEFFTLVKNGRLGKNRGLDTGLPKLDSVVGGNQRGLYTLIFGGTGSGKSSYAIYANLYKPMMSMFGNPQYKAVLYSLELSTAVVIAKLTCLHIWETYGVEISYKKLIGKKEKEHDIPLTDKEFELVEKCNDWLKVVLETHLIIHDKGLNADILYASLSNILDELGTTTETEHQKTYNFHDPDQYLFVFIDHISLLRKAAGRSKKEEIDLASNYLVTLRNRCKISPIVLMQSNRTGMSMDRRNANMIEPQLEDIKDSGGPSEDAEIVIALFYPHREKMVTYRGYQIANTLRGYFRSAVCLKNRFGEADVSVGLNFYGSIGLFREMPVAEDISDYEPYLDLKYKKNEIQEIMQCETVEKDKNINTFTL